MKTIIGLGNPDAEYESTYHNVGHQFLDFIKKDEKLKIKSEKLVKTDVYMNESGKFVKEALKNHKAKPDSLLIVHDDSDIALGKYKLSFARNAGGHRGVQNIIDQLKTNAFWRLRIGIRPLREKVRAKADELVLKKISPANRKKLEGVFKEIVVRGSGRADLFDFRPITPYTSLQ